MEDLIFIQNMSFDNEERPIEILSVDHAGLKYDPDPKIPPKIVVIMQFMHYDTSAPHERTEILSIVLQLRNNMFYPEEVNSEQLHYAAIVNKAINVEKVITEIKYRLVEKLQ